MAGVRQWMHFLSAPKFAVDKILSIDKAEQPRKYQQMRVIYRTCFGSDTTIHEEETTSEGAEQ